MNDLDRITQRYRVSQSTEKEFLSATHSILLREAQQIDAVVNQIISLVDGKASLTGYLGIGQRAAHAGCRLYDAVRGTKHAQGYIEARKKPIASALIDEAVEHHTEFIDKNHVLIANALDQSDALEQDRMRLYEAIDKRGEEYEGVLQQMDALKAARREDGSMPIATEKEIGGLRYSAKLLESVIATHDFILNGKNERYQRMRGYVQRHENFELMLIHRRETFRAIKQEYLEIGSNDLGLQCVELLREHGHVIKGMERLMVDGTSASVARLTIPPLAWMSEESSQRAQAQEARVEDVQELKSEHVLDILKKRRAEYRGM
ncbi:hypothetical protein HY492_01210 [Candidatus Woesearchaeota archaeon]|nr:hypothetical protein [Candidatus Woesearchaeota archaeon]